MVSEDGSGPRNGPISGGRSGGGSQQVLKKGPWTAAEDAILMEYVKKSGEGNWNAVQRNSGLKRCGKSCRLRWANHLRPNLKKGTFTADEESLIIELHAKLGNKWARMASQLPGRTDNEIKNYWNTRVKRRQRVGLPIYPREIPEQTQPNSSLSSSSLSSSVSSSSSSHPQKPNFNSSFSLFNSLNFQTTHLNSSSLPNSNHYFKLFRDNDGGLALSLSSSVLPFSSSSASAPLFNQNLPTEYFPKTTFQFDSINLKSNPTVVKGASVKPLGSETGLSSIQKPNAITSSVNTESEYVMDESSDEYGIGGEVLRGNSGLLEDLLEESQALMRADKAKKESFVAEDKSKGKCKHEDGFMKEATADKEVESVFRVEHTQENHWKDSSFAYSAAIGMKAKKDAIEEMNIMDEDLLSLLEVPLNVPVPEWYGESENVTNGQLSNTTNGNVLIDQYREALRSPAMANHDWTLGSCCWNNIPSIS